MFSGLTDWWRRRNAAKCSYTAHEYLHDTWNCNKCAYVVHTNALASHARIMHGMDTTRLHIERVRRPA